MDARQCKYLVKIADCGSISKAAEELYISQSGLNQQLFRIERAIGATIFDRTTHSLKTTEAGEAVLRYARDTLRREDRMLSEVRDIVDGTTGEIRINLAMEQGVQIFCSVFPQFHQRYPRVYIHLEDHIVAEQYRLLMKNELDIGMVMVSKKDVPQFEYIPLAKERFLLGIPAGHPLLQEYPATDDGELPLMELSRCKKEYFSLMFSGSTMRQVIDPCFRAAGFSPNILFESRTNHVVALMASNGICLTILPESQARLYRSIRWFRIPGDPSWENCIVYHKDHPPRKAGRYFIELAKSL